MAVKVTKAVDFPGEAAGHARRPAQQGHDRRQEDHQGHDRPGLPHQDRQGLAGRQSREPVLPGGDHAERRADRAQHRDAARCGSTCRCRPRPNAPAPAPVGRRGPQAGAAAAGQAALPGWRSSGWRPSRPRPPASNAKHRTRPGHGLEDRCLRPTSINQGLDRNESHVSLDRPDRGRASPALPRGLAADSPPARRCRRRAARRGLRAAARPAPLTELAVYPARDPADDRPRPPVDRGPGDLRRRHHPRRDRGGDADPGRPQRWSAATGRPSTRRPTARRRLTVAFGGQTVDAAGQGRAGDRRSRRSASGST